MAYLVIAWDGTDEGAWDRRLAVREEHFAYVRRQHAKGLLVGGGAMRDESGERLIGSIAILNCESEEEVREHLSGDPYVRSGVWRDIKIHPYRVWQPEESGREKI